MPTTMSCPTVHELQQYLLGQSPEAEAARIEQHLSQCGRCLESLQQFQPEDTVVAALRAQGTKGLESNDDFLKARIECPASCTRPPPIPPPPRRPTNARRMTSWLRPSAGRLGRLGPYRVLKMPAAAQLVFRSTSARRSLIVVPSASASFLTTPREGIRLPRSSKLTCVRCRPALSARAS